MVWYLYMLRCGNGDFYTGITANLERRLAEHQSRIGGRFTRMAHPVELVYQEVFETSTEAKRRERQIKSWSRGKKLALIAGERQALKAA